MLFVPEWQTSEASELSKKECSLGKRVYWIEKYFHMDFTGLKTNDSS
jgi:hypothetical protein